MVYTKTYRTYNASFILPYSSCIRQFPVQTVLEVHSDIHIGLQWCVNYCSTSTKTGTLTNFSILPNKKFCENLYRGLSNYMQTDRQTNKHSEAKRHTVKIFHYKYAKKINGSFLEMLTRHYLQWWNNLSLFHTSLMNAAEKTTHF